MQKINTLAELEALYGTPAEASLIKVAKRLTPGYRAWINRSRFCLLSTVGPDGTDCSPRGDEGPVVHELDPGTLALPDWHGNNRIDSLRNILADDRVSLTFMITGSSNVVRVNGRAVLSADQALLARYERDGKLPRSVTVISIQEIYFQCARALLRSALWSGDDQSQGLPTAGDLLTEMTKGSFDGASYDQAWPERAAKSMW